MAKKKEVPVVDESVQSPAVASELIDVVPADSVVAEYRQFYSDLVVLEKENAALVFQYRSKAGNKEARSHIHKLRLTKGSLDRVRQEAKDESLKVGRAIDAEAAQIKARIEAMIAVHQTQIDAIEKEEADRVAALTLRVKQITEFGSGLIASSDIQGAMNELAVTNVGEDFAEMQEAAKMAKAKRVDELESMLAAAIKHEDEQRELALLRIKAAEQERLARDREVAEAAAKQAREEAEERGRVQKEAAERRAIEATMQADNAKRQLEEASRRAEEQRQQAERDKAQAAEDAKRQVEESARRAEEQKAQAARDQAQALEDERARVQAEADAVARAVEARSNDEKHRAKINRAVLDAMTANGIDDAMARRCISLIVKGLIPWVKINY